MSMSFDELSYKLEPILTKEPYWTDDNLVFLSEIPTKFPFERIKVEEVFKDNQWQDDLNFDDSAMVYKGKDGLVIIVEFVILSNIVNLYFLIQKFTVLLVVFIY